MICIDMRKNGKKVAGLALAMLLCTVGIYGCWGVPVSGSASPGGIPTASAPPVTEPPVASASPSPSPTPTPAPQGVFTEEVYAQFARIGFSAVSGGAPAIGKWTQPLRIEVKGNPGAGDLKALGSFVEKIEYTGGMPEVAFVTDGGNITIYFLPLKNAGEADASFDGTDTAQAAVHWEGIAPVSAKLFVADELAGQEARDAALAGLLLRGLGLLPDSRGTAAVSDAEWLTLALLYDTKVEPGMRKAEAMPVVRTLDPWTGGRSANNPNLKASDILSYLNEVGFWYASDSSSDGIVSKWAAPIKLQLMGIPSEDETALVNQYAARLNGIQGFPGIEIVQSGGNFVVTCQPYGAVKKIFPNLTEVEACRMSLTQKNGTITKCTIGVSTDYKDAVAARTQFLRLFIGALGFAYSSDAWPDSIMNYSADVLDWSALDWKMVELLYRSEVKPGAKRAAVMKALEKGMN
jgi:hypothetical protein